MRIRHLTQAAKEKRLDVAKARFRFLDDDTGELTDGPMILPTDMLEGGALFAALSIWALIKGYCAENAPGDDEEPPAET